MSTNDMQHRIETVPANQRGLGATDAEIVSASVSLTVPFPDSFRAFLRMTGWTRFSHNELYGLGADVPLHLDLVRNTLAERQDMEPALPKHLIPIMNDGAGNHFCLDTSVFDCGECPVVFWDHEAGKRQIPEAIGPSFDAWLIETLSAQPR